MSNLAKQRKISLTIDCDKALKLLKSKGVNDNDFIRIAIEEKLYKDFRKILKQIEENNKEKIPF